MATIHVFLLNQHGIMDDPTDSIIYGPSTSNKIERWWRELHERLEKFFKEKLVALLRGREYDPHVALHRQLLAYVFIPIILVQYSDKFMQSIVLYSIVLRRSQLYCIVNLLLCAYNTIQCSA